MKRLQTRIPASIQKDRLDLFLAEWLPTALGFPVSRAKIRTLLFSGGVYVNRHRNKNGLTPVYAGAIIEVYYDEEKLNASQPQRMETVRLSASSIIFEDEWLIVINKPSGLPTQPTVDPNRSNLFDLLKKFMEEREKKPSYVGMHHRLDRDTSGVILFTKREEANKGVADLFFSHQIQKTYQCMTWRSPVAPVYEAGKIFSIENFLGKVSEKGEISRFGEVRSGGDHALTYFRVIEKFRDVYWMEAKPHTGRTHQIRVHCSEAGFPILGDTQYFPTGINPFIVVPRLMLHASQLEFIHPMTGKKITIEAPLPGEYFSLLSTLKA